MVAPNCSFGVFGRYGLEAGEPPPVIAAVIISLSMGLLTEKSSVYW